MSIAKLRINLKEQSGQKNQMPIIFLEYSDSEIYDNLHEILKKYENHVTFKTWRPNKECPHYEKEYIANVRVI